jgi:hypothetical protein
MTPRAMHRSPGTYFTAEENAGNPQLGDFLMKKFGKIAQHVRK